MDISRCHIDTITYQNVDIRVWRWDEIHPLISGNKLFKLIGFESRMRAQGLVHCLSFGGAYSNHLHAAAAWAQHNNFQLHAVIRGEELAENTLQNPTLESLKNQGVKLHYVSRTAYQLKDRSPEVASILSSLPPCMIIPEGGQGPEGEVGFEILKKQCPTDVDAVIVSVGTGTTLKGLRKIFPPHIPIIGVTSFKSWEEQFSSEYLNSNNVQIWSCHDLGKFGQYTDDLIAFANDFYRDYHIPLDIVYTSKMMKKLWSFIDMGKIKLGSHILAIHTGGVQGNQSVRERLIY